MRKINKPSISCVDVFDDIVGNDQMILSKLSRNVAIQNSDLYEKKSVNVDLYSLPKKQDKKLEDLYKKLYKKEIYNKIINNVNDQRCLYCTENEVSDLDHFMPKSKYAQYAISPINLIPSCRNCNKYKSANIPNSPSEQILHPYFDKDILFNEQWLYSEIKEGSTPVAKFFVKTEPNWIQEDIDRVKKHFDLLKIGSRFNGLAAVYISEIQHRMEQQPNAESRKKIILDRYESIKSNKVNSLRTALFYGLSESEWYCKEGYKLTG